MFKSITTIAVLLCTTVLFSQRPKTDREITVTGKVLEADSNIPLEYATVSFTNGAGEIVTGGITDPTGTYSIDVPTGIYTVKFEFISFETKSLSNQELFKDTTLPTQTLALDSKALDEVVIRSETTEVEVRLDKKVYNIGKDLTTSGATVGDALGNVPSVTVDTDGAVSLRGNENVRILINGKPSAIAGFGSTDALQQLPADAIERVEVITSPSARYDAEGTAGILNIILRKDKTLGFNGSVQLNVGDPLTYGVTTNLNYRTENYNLFNTTGFNKRKQPGMAFFENSFFNVDPITGERQDLRSVIREDREYDRERGGFNTNLGIEYYLSESSSLTASAFLRLGDNESITTNDTDDLFPDLTRDESRVRTETENEKDLSYQFSLNYENKFNDEGHELSAALQYARDEEEELSFIEERVIFPADSELPAEDITQIENQNEYLAQIDYVLPIGENAQFEAGYRGNFEETETDYELLEQEIPMGAFVVNNSLTNIFTYKEDVHAIYTQYGNKLGEFSFLLGLRYESTRQRGEVEAIPTEDALDVDLDFDNTYDGLFPTVNLIYEIGEEENITLGYNRRINRPRGFFINPFPSRSSEANIFQGNPSLRPAFANAFDLGYLKRWDKVTLTSSVYYQYETDAFERIQEDTGDVTSNGVSIIRTIPINLATNERLGLEAGILYNPKKWLRLNGSFNFFQFTTEGSFNDQDFGAQNTSYFARVSAKVSLPYKIEWQTTAFYRGPRNNAQTDTEGIFSANLAISKDLFKEKATLSLNVRDLFNSRIRRSFTDSPGFTSDSQFQWRVRSANLSFIYRFNQKKQRQRGGERDGGDDDFEG